MAMSPSPPPVPTSLGGNFSSHTAAEIPLPFRGVWLGGGCRLREERPTQMRPAAGHRLGAVFDPKNLHSGA